ncbi:MAG: Calvin cycle protein CP12 [Elainellaceae cyanobacterium]
MTNIDNQIEQEREQARAICDSEGASSDECAVAWDSVEEMQAEAAHKRQATKKNSLETYCDDNPEAAECRIYDD